MCIVLYVFCNEEDLLRSLRHLVCLSLKCAVLTFVRSFVRTYIPQLHPAQEAVITKCIWVILFAWMDKRGILSRV